MASNHIPCDPIDDNSFECEINEVDSVHESSSDVKQLELLNTSAKQRNANQTEQSTHREKEDINNGSSGESDYVQDSDLHRICRSEFLQIRQESKEPLKHPTSISERPVLSLSVNDSIQPLDAFQILRFPHFGDEVTLNSRKSKPKNLIAETDFSQVIVKSIS